MAVAPSLCEAESESVLHMVSSRAFQQLLLSTNRGAECFAVQEQRMQCKPANNALYLDTYPTLTALKRGSFCLNCCVFVIVTPFLTVAVLWKTGADIVQWLIKNLSIEDPGRPAYRC